MGRLAIRIVGALIGGGAWLGLSAAPCAASLIPFTANPTTNSTDFTNYLTGLGLTVNSNVNFSAHPVGPLQGGFYSSSDGVTLSATGSISDIQFGPGPGQSNTSTGPVSSGEGTHAAANFLFADSSLGTLTISFDQPVLGAGLFTIDLFNPGSQSLRNTVTLEAFTGPNGTGTSLGAVSSAAFNFQRNRLYFMGVASTDGDIGSIVFTTPGSGNDQIGLTNILFATDTGMQPIPEPGGMALWMLGTAGLACFAGYRKRRKARLRVD